MSYKLGFLAGAAAGYVLGSRAGRTRYEDIKRQSAKAWSSRTVQSSLADAQGAVKAKAPSMTHGLVDKAFSAVQTSPVTPGTTGAGTSGTSGTVGAHRPDSPTGPAFS